MTDVEKAATTANIVVAGFITWALLGDYLPALAGAVAIQGVVIQGLAERVGRDSVKNSNNDTTGESK